ncbi:glucose-1-phosphate adenylyltransferase [Desulfitobacterium metallireducens]|uniref:Glucose-1-phosphate adenylyltransferase n=1 Tax=Desulfitobacterium metallireducens DSM 15288 TaxID=871968 RepID=W0ECL6_9FIRM|nr:glucose-1-phosphate adenylyltransferase [Desulfitobacterium metallireducens]AHF06806.1 glucose-1-phosphate adenylyltransferase [Desulfitobacterium metallireducens DSM 15288]
MLKKECVAMLLAGGQGSRLGCLTRNIAKPAVSFGGKYRIIDFSLSNCSHSNIDTVGVVTQYKPFILNSYIGTGSAWDLDRAFGGVNILPPYMGETEGSWYKGTANAIYQNIDFINHYDPEYVLIISGDHIYKMNYVTLLEFHKEKEAEVTISTLEVPWKEATRFGIMSVDEDYKITKFQEKPYQPESNLASMGVYLFNWSVLKEALIEDEMDEDSEHDFGKNVIPMLLNQGRKLYAYSFQGYWKDVGTIESYYQASMESLRSQESVNLFDPEFRILSNDTVQTPHYVGVDAKIENSLICNGCIVLGKVSNSILAPGVYVGEASEVKDSIVLPHAKIDANTYIEKAIIGEKTEIQSHCLIRPVGKYSSAHSGITVVQDHDIVPQGTVLEAGGLCR